MRKNLLVAIAGVFALGISAPAMAQDNISGLSVGEGGAGTIFLAQSSSTNRKSSRYQCSDPTATSTLISVAVADCCVAGDIYRATIYKGVKQSKFNHTLNAAGGVNPGAPAFAPDVFSPDATIGTKVSKVDIVTTAGNTHPGGLGAGWTVRVSTNAGGPVCSLKQNIN